MFLSKMQDGNNNRTMTRSHSGETCPEKYLVKKKRVAWNKGLTRESDQRVKRNSDAMYKTYKDKVSKGIYKNKSIMSPEARKRLSERQSLHNSGGRCKWYRVNGKSVQGSYEKLFAEALEKQNIVWEKIKTNIHLFKYIANGVEKSYSPDFYLPEFKLYIEIKGFWWGNDLEKMKLVRSQHSDKDVVIIFGKNKLDLICTDIKKYLPLEQVWSL